MRELPIPPEDLRLWVGPFGDPGDFIRSGEETLRLLTALCDLRPHHYILDVGCGSGRVALALTRYLSAAGRYTGFDSAKAPISWCATHIAPRYPNFSFAHVGVRNASYSPEGDSMDSGFTFPVASDAVDVALLSSVFTHMLLDEVAIYLREVRRVLRRGGCALISYFLLDAEGRRAIGAGDTIFDFRHPHGRCATLSPDEPTAGVAYDEEFALGELRAAGLAVTHVERGTWRSARSYAAGQDWIVARKEQ